MLGGAWRGGTILIFSTGMPKPKCSPFSEFLILFRNPPSAIWVTSYTCFTCAGFFASWSNSPTFHSDFVYTNWPSALFPVPIAANAATPVAAVLTNDLRLILFIISLVTVAGETEQKVDL